MPLIECYCPSIGPLKVLGKCLHNGHDFAVLSNSDDVNVDYLLFLDSRGVSREFKQSLADKLITEISRLGKTYILICRPLELTIWATLIGFLKINKINPKKIITNMGFVDFTPKKQSILQDAVGQVELVLGKGVAKTSFTENYISADNSISLYSVHYSERYQLAIEDIARQHELVIINTPLVNENIVIERKRPASFFAAQIESNKFNHSISRAQIIDLPDFDESLTYDAVHYTSCGNELIFNKVKDYL